MPPEPPAKSTMKHRAESFAADTKDALARELPDAPHCRAALRDALRGFGDPRATGMLRTRRLAVARLVRVIAQTPPEVTIRSHHEVRLDRAAVYDVALEGIAEPWSPPRRRCDRRMALRAAFLMLGSIADPRRGYHLEFRAAEAPHAQAIVALLADESIAAGVIRRRGHIVVYLKRLDAIVGLLAAIGAYDAVLSLEGVRAVKETKNRIRRLVNTDAANVVRATTAAAAQCEALRIVADAFGLRRLSPALREAATLRLAHPDESLAELGARCRPVVGKATFGGRITTLVRLAERLRGDMGANGIVLPTIGGRREKHTARRAPQQRVTAHAVKPPHPATLPDDPLDH